MESNRLCNVNYQILLGIPIFGIDSPLPHAGELWHLSRCVGKGVQMTIVADHLNNAGFNIIAKSSLLELMYVINQENPPLQMDITGAMLYRIILPYH